MDKTAILKTAAEQLRAMAKELTETRAKTAQLELAINVVNKLQGSEMVSGSEILEKLSQYSQKTTDELTVIEKAIELRASGELSKLGSLNDAPDDVLVDGVDPLTSMLLEDYT